MNKKTLRAKTRLDFLALFPEMREIKDRTLRSGVLRLWNRATQESEA